MGIQKTVTWRVEKGLGQLKRCDSYKSRVGTIPENTWGTQYKKYMKFVAILSYNNLRDTLAASVKSVSDEIHFPLLFNTCSFDNPQQ